MTNNWYFTNDDKEVYYGDPNDGGWRVLVASCIDAQHADYIAASLNNIPHQFEFPRFA